MDVNNVSVLFDQVREILVCSLADNVFSIVFGFCYKLDDRWGPFFPIVCSLVGARPSGGRGHFQFTVVDEPTEKGARAGALTSTFQRGLLAGRKGPFAVTRNGHGQGRNCKKISLNFRATVIWKRIAARYRKRVNFLFFQWLNGANLETEKKAF